MGFQQKVIVFLFQASLASLMLPLVCSSQEHKKTTSSHPSNTDNNSLQMNQKLQFEIRVHGFLLWASMGFLMPVGIIAIRLSNRERNQRRLRIIFYVHTVLQIFAVLLGTAGAIMSIKNFNNSFNNNHQRVGVALYGVIWLQFLVGVFRPLRGSRRRRVWFFSHWIIGTALSLFGVLSVYSGLQAYKEKTSKSVTIWNILFTAEVSLVVFFYLIQDKWLYIQKQALILGSELRNPNAQEICPHDKQEELKTEPC